MDDWSADINCLCSEIGLSWSDFTSLSADC
jgi:hypothetical protein